jgi:hypothetical protein
MALKRRILLGTAFLISISLSYSELYFNTFRTIENVDEYNNIKLAISAFNSLKQGIIPIRVADGIFCNLGYPIHQFYSPLPHIIIALFSFFNDNIYTGFALSVIFSIFISFIYSFKLIQYLFKDELYAFVGAFIYICAPYMSIVRVIRGAYPEFFAICLLPIVLYYIIKAINNLSIGNLTLSIIMLSILFTTHLITSFYFLLFSGFFFLLHAIFVIFKVIKFNKPYLLNKLRNKFLLLSIILIFSLLLSLWHLAPVIFYDNVAVKSILYASDLYRFKQVTNLLSLFSISDAPPELLDKIGVFRLQTGLLFNFCLFLAFLLYKNRFKSNYFIPMVLTQFILLILIIYPFGIGSSIQKILFLVQFTYRFISFYNLIGIFLIIITLKYIVNNTSKENKQIIKLCLSICIITYSILSISPYQRNYTKANDNIFGIYDFNDIAAYDYFMGGVNYEYAINLTQYSSNIPLVNNNFFIKRNNNSTLNSQIFEFNIEDYANKLDFNNFFDLETLFYPDLQYITINIDDKVYNNTNFSFNKKFLLFPNLINDELNLVINTIYGLRISNLPNKGHVSISIQFEGYNFANLVSQLTILIYLSFIYYLKKYRTKTLSSKNKYRIRL